MPAILLLLLFLLLWSAPHLQAQQDDAMVMEGTIYYLAQKRSATFRGSWTPLTDGRVRQFFEEKDKHGNWQVWFDGYYAREE